MSGIKRLPCIQHIKRKFLYLKDNPQAQEIAKLFGLLYNFEHKHRIGKDGWTEEKHLKWRQRYSKVMLENEQKAIRVHDFNRRISKNIKEVCESLGIQCVTPRYARNSFIQPWHIMAL